MENETKLGELHKNVGRTWGRKKQRTNIKKSTVTFSEETCIEDDGGDICLNVHTEEILSYLPASKLQTLKRVCKYWQHLITSPHFIKLHLSRANQSIMRVLMSCPLEIMEYNYNEGTKKIPYPPHISGLKTMILGSADGVICMVDDRIDEESKYTLFNPSTGNYLDVHTFNSNHIICFWFGKLPSSGECVLVMGTFSPGPHFKFGAYKLTHSMLIPIHTISFDLQIPYPGSFISPRRGILVDGVVHWAVRLCVNRRIRYTIMAYHPNENKFWEMSPPAQCQFSLGVTGEGCLLAILKNKLGVFEVWIMKECWTKYVNIEGFSSSKMLFPLGFLPNGDMILDVDNSELIKYSFKDNKDTSLVQYGCLADGAVMCADSLVSGFTAIGD